MNENEFLENKIGKIEREILSPITFEDLMKKEFPEIGWIVEQLIPAEAIVGLSGLPSAYKTWLILVIALAVAQGSVLFDKFLATSSSVLIIDEETGERWMKQRITKVQRDLPNTPVYLLSKTGFKLTPASVKGLLAFSKDKGVRLIIFDSLLRIHTATDENNAVEMAKVFGLFQQLNKAGISVLFTHHNRKPGLMRSSNPSQDMRGSSDIFAALDSHIAVERGENFLKLTQTKLRQGEECKPFKLNIITEEDEVRFEFAGDVEQEQSRKDDFKNAIQDLLKEKEDVMYKKEIFDALKNIGVGGGYSTFKTALEELIKDGTVFIGRGEKNKAYCSLKPVESEPNLPESHASFDEG